MRNWLHRSSSAWNGESDRFEKPSNESSRQLGNAEGRMWMRAFA